MFRSTVVFQEYCLSRGASYRVDFKTELAPGASLTFEVEAVFFNLLKPYPEEITQADKQYVLYNGNVYFYSLYQTKQQTTSVVLSSDKVESYTQLKPTTKSDSTITYGPYENIKPFEQVSFLERAPISSQFTPFCLFFSKERIERPQREQQSILDHQKDDQNDRNLSLGQHRRRGDHRHVPLGRQVGRLVLTLRLHETPRRISFSQVLQDQLASTCR